MKSYRTFYMKKEGLKPLLLVLMFCISTGISAQVDKEKKKKEKQTTSYLRAASEDLESDNFTGAEVDLRKAIALSPSDETGKYNLANAYYNKALNDEAMRRYVQAAEVAENKSEKHKAFHNLGNTFMNAKKYQEAVEAYKNALRNNPTDDETRYNLALAKEMLEKNPPESNDQNKEDEEQKDQDENKDQNQENKDDQGENKEGDEGDDKEDKDKGDQQDENKDGENKDDQGKPKDQNEQKDGEGEQPKQPVPGKLSPQQVQNLLEAMNNEEKKVQDKINAKKQKGAKVKSEKDW